VSIIELESHQIDKVVREELLTFKHFLERDYNDPAARVRFEDKQADNIYVSDCIDAIGLIIEWYEPMTKIREKRER